MKNINNRGSVTTILVVLTFTAIVIAVGLVLWSHFPVNIPLFILILICAVVFILGMTIVGSLTHTDTNRIVLELRDRQMQYIAKSFHLSYASSLPSWNRFPVSYLKKDVEIGKMNGTVNGHTIFIRETWHPLGYFVSHRLGSQLVSYVEIDGSGGEYRVPDSALQTEIPLDKLWDTLRTLAGSTIDVPEKWPQTAVQLPQSFAMRTLLLALLGILAGVALIVWSFFR